MSDTKKCSKCGEVKGLGEFGKHAARKDGLDTRCKQCNRDAANAYRRANLDSVREKDRIRAAALTADERRAKHKRWRDANRDYVRETGRETMRRLYRLDPEKFRAARREWYAANTEKARSSHARWCAENTDRIAEYGREYRAANAEKVAAFLAAYRARPDVKAANRERKRKDVSELGDNYVKRVIFPDGIPQDIPPELIALKREQLAIKRMARELKKAATKPTGENE